MSFLRRPEDVLKTSVSAGTGFRCSRSQMFLKMGVLKKFVNDTGEYLCWSFFLTKLEV